MKLHKNPLLSLVARYNARAWILAFVGVALIVAIGGRIAIALYDFNLRADGRPLPLVRPAPNQGYLTPSAPLMSSITNAQVAAAMSSNPVQTQVNTSFQPAIGAVVQVEWSTNLIDWLPIAVGEVDWISFIQTNKCGFFRTQQ